MAGAELTPMIDDVMMIEPPSFISGSPYLQTRNEARTFTAITRSNRSSG